MIFEKLLRNIVKIGKYKALLNVKRAVINKVSKSKGLM
jgi:hypothetical protein